MFYTVHIQPFSVRLICRTAKAADPTLLHYYVSLKLHIYIKAMRLIKLVYGRKYSRNACALANRPPQHTSDGGSAFCFFLFCYMRSVRKQQAVDSGYTMWSKKNGKKRQEKPFGAGLSHQNLGCRRRSSPDIPWRHSRRFSDGRTRAGRPAAL